MGTDDPADDLPSTEALDDAGLESVLEALLLIVDAPVGAEALASAAGVPEDRVRRMLVRMAAAYTNRKSGIDLRFAGEGWRLYTRSDYAPYVENLLKDSSRAKLTRAALETLAVVAYRQPVTRARVSAVRGVNVDGVMRSLLARGLIAEAGPDPDTGATRYSTTELFLERLGMASLTQLPPLAPLLPDVDVIDELNDELDVRASKGTSSRGRQPPTMQFDRD